jgi:hypothetical protein
MNDTSLKIKKLQETLQKGREERMIKCGEEINAVITKYKARLAVTITFMPNGNPVYQINPVPMD